MVKGFSKDDLGINGVHGDLGRQLNEAEFRGYMSASVKALQDGQNQMVEEMRRMEERLIERMEDMRENKDSEHKAFSTRLESVEKRVGAAEAFQNKLLGIAAVISAGSALIFGIISKAIFK